MEVQLDKGLKNWPLATIVEIKEAALCNRR